MRINKFLALHKYSTRRGADELIKAGKVKINGRKAVLGDQVSEADKVVVDAKSIAKLAEQYVYFVYNKLINVDTNNLPSVIPDSRSGIHNCLPVGRLDKNSHGLIILTNDGRVTDRLLNPEYEHEKEYLVKVT